MMTAPGAEPAYGQPLPGGPPPRKTFTPALIGALVALAILAVVTVIVVVSGGSDDDQHTATSSSAPPDGSASASVSATTSAGPGDGSAQATDGSFSYDLPSGYEDATGDTGTSNAVLEIYDPDSHSTFPTTMIVTKENVGNTSLDDVVSQTRDAVESALSVTTSDMAVNVTDIDGEPVKAFETSEYTRGSATGYSLLIITIHDGTAYGFTLNAESDNTGDGGDAMLELAKSVVWK